VQQGLKAHWDNPSAEPLPAEYLLYNDLIWQFGAPKLPPEFATWWERSGAQPNILPSALPDAMTLADAAGGLVEDEAMYGWVRWSKALWNNVKYRSQQPPDVPSTTLISLLLREMSRMPDHRLLLKSMAAGLRTQTLWYAVAGNTVQAERAALLAQATAILPITENPLVAGLLAKGLGA
jgi:hypothetical protein